MKLSKTRSLIIACLLVISNAVSAQVPAMNSYPAASETVYLDFDGQYVSGTIWNWNGPIAAQNAALSPSSITEIFTRVAEDFRPFHLNITTDSTVYWNAPAAKRIRIIVTASSSWYGNAGGVAFVGSFAWGDNSPAWVFASLLGNHPKFVAEAISHEAGHTLGLQHQSSYDENCNKTAEYNIGTGAGEIGWAPIMGAGYYENITTWHRGSATIGCSYIQDDFADILLYTGVHLRSDDHTNDIAAAAVVPVYGGFFSMDGIINNADDADVFKIEMPVANHFRIAAIPQNVGADNEGANIDIKVVLMNGSDTIGKYNPSTLLNAGLDTNLNAGTYYIVVDGVGNEYLNDFGSMGYYALNGTLETVLGLNHLDLNGISDKNALHQFAWSFRTDEEVEAIVLESSQDGRTYNVLAKMKGDASHYFYKPQGSQKYFYRLRIITAGNPKGYLSNIISLQSSAGETDVKLVGPAFAGNLTVSSMGNYPYQILNSNGQILQRGKLVNGINHLQLSSAKGLLLLRYNGVSGISTQKFILQ